MSGFTLSSQDLEMRGSGNILGEEQTGQVNEIGVSLYQEMLQKTINSLKLDNIESNNSIIDVNKPIDLNIVYRPDGEDTLFWCIYYIINELNLIYKHIELNINKINSANFDNILTKFCSNSFFNINI